MTPRDNNHDSLNHDSLNRDNLSRDNFSGDQAQRDAELAGAFFNEEPHPAPLDDPAVRARTDRWHRALDVLAELEPCPAAATIEPHPVHRIEPLRQDAGRALHWTSSPWFRTGLAAAVVLLTTLLLVGTEVRATNGTLVVRFGPIGRSAGPSSVLPTASEAHYVTSDQMNELVQRRTDDRLSAFVVDLAEAFSTMERRRREDDAALVSAILQLRQSDLQRIDRIMEELALDSAQQSRITRDSFARLIQSGAIRLPMPGDGDGVVRRPDALY